MTETLSPYQQWKKNLGETRPWDMLNPHTEYVEKKVAKNRLDICKSCPFLVKATHQCKKCGCLMDLKTKLKNAKCPVGKWGAPFNAKVVSSFITKEESNKIIDVVKKIEVWQSGGSDFWDNRVLSASYIYEKYDKDLGKFLYDLRIKIGESIKELYNLDEIYPDLFQVIRWFPGMEQPVHADDMTNTEGNDWFRHRHFGSILYLNNDYEGGHTYYPQHNVSIIPEAGELAIHPGDTDHMHGVTKVEGAVRYTIASFWTKDKAYFDNWSIPE